MNWCARAGMCETVCLGGVWPHRGIPEGPCLGSCTWRRPVALANTQGRGGQYTDCPQDVVSPFRVFRILPS